MEALKILVIWAVTLKKTD